jgi:NitT/TauT family transport system ATP-binding protein
VADVTFLQVDIAEKKFPAVEGGEFIALSGLNFSVPKGQFTCIVGPSGTGKTTLLNILSGLDTKYQGSVTIDGNTPKEAPPLGYMFQSPRLMPWLTVLENIRIVANESARNENRAEKLLEEMDLGGFMETFPNRLSGGMQRRAALARAFVNQPPMLLLDEPFISLDTPVADRLRHLLLDLCRAHNATVVFVTHDLREAVQLGDRILFMSPSPGRVVLDQPIDLARPRVSDSEEMEAFRSQLLKDHPDILAGLDKEEAAIVPAHQQE